MSKGKFITAAKRGESWTERPPRGVHVRSAEGYAGRIAGFEPRRTVEVTDAQVRNLLAEIERDDDAPSTA
jgi:hypothetical protein